MPARCAAKASSATTNRARSPRRTSAKGISETSNPARLRTSSKGKHMSKTSEEVFGAAPHERPVPRISIHAFCEFPDTGAALQRASQDRLLYEAPLTVQLGGI